jgi:hypothetical protein
MKKIKCNISHCTFLLITLILTFGSVSGQTMKSFPKIVDSNLTLDSGDYVVKGNNIVRSTVTLSIHSGTALHFSENAVIQVKGGLRIKGNAGDFVTITSLDDTKPGMGFTILQESNSKVDIQYADFNKLKKPIKFERYWLRQAVDIKNSMFHHMNHGVYFEIQEIDKILIRNSLIVNITGNTFSNNTGSLMISDAAWEQLHINITNNVFSRNEFIGRELNGIFTTPLFINYNEKEGQLKQPAIKDNSISYNYVGLIGYDTVEFLPVYLTAVGSADKSLTVKELSTNLFGGQVLLTGLLNTVDPLAPLADLNITVQNLSVQKAFTSFETLRKIAPVFEQIDGQFSSTVKLQTELLKDFSPNLSHITCQGILDLFNCDIESLTALTTIGSKLELDAFRKPLNIKYLLISFSIVDGKVEVNPFSLPIGESSLSLAGYSKLDKVIHFDGLLSVPKKLYTENNNGFNQYIPKSTLSNIDSFEWSDLEFDLNIGGTYIKPVVVIDFKSTKNRAKENIKSQVKSKVDSQKEILKK